MPSDNDPEFPPLVLTFAASDPSGGAGLQADILTLASMGCHPLSVVTAITVQDTLGVEGLQALDAEWVADQARCLLEDMPVDAFKIGVLGSVEIIAAIAEIVSDYPDVPLILDPVLASGRGDEFATEDMQAAMRELLLPQTTILTPNSVEVRRLAEVDDDDETLSRRVRRQADRDGCRIRARHRHARAHAAGRQHALRERRRRAHRLVGAPLRQLPRFGLHARVRDRRDARQRARSCRRPCARRRTTRGTHSRRRTAPAWASFCRTGCSGRARSPARPRVKWNVPRASDAGSTH